MTIEHFINLSTTEPNNDVGIIKIRQSDEQTQTLVVQITENGVPKDFTGYQPFFCAKIGQALGLGVIEQAVSVSTPAEGKLSYTFKEADWQELGRQTGYFAFRNAQGRQFSTRDFNYTVTPSVFSEGLQEVKKDGSTYIQTFEDMLRLFNEYVAQGKTDWTAFVEQNRAILESVDPGGVILTELIDARENADGQAFGNLSARLNGMDATSAALQESVTQTVGELRGDVTQTVGDLRDEVTQTTTALKAEVKEQYENINHANSKGFLAIPVFNNADDYQTTHPSVLHFADGWGGYKYWMGVTPYEKSNEWLENPSVLASQDGLKWEVPTGGSNPLVMTHDGVNMHYSDTHLVMVSNQLECWYRKSYRGTNPAQEIVCRKKTTDGKTWTEEEYLHTKDGTGSAMLCPVVRYKEGKYRIWTINYPVQKIEYFESITGGTWSKIRDIDFPTHPDSHVLWHMDIVENNGLYELYYCAGDVDVCPVLCYATSSDNETYTFVADVMVNMQNNFDELSIYRPSICDIDDKRLIYYGARDHHSNWYTGLTVGKVSTPTKLTGFTFSNMAGFDATKAHSFYSAVTPKPPELYFGTYGRLRETELKLVNAGVADMRLRLEPSLPDAFHVRSVTWDETSAYAAVLMHRLHLWDAPQNKNEHYLSVENGRLRFFDGQINQFIHPQIYAFTSERPANPVDGQSVFDRTLNKPIWYSNGSWVDAMGTIV